MNNQRNFTAPVGRLVSGDPWTGYDSDFQNRPYTDRSGQAVKKWSFGVAIPKNAPGINEFFGVLLQAAREGHPTKFDTAGNVVAGVEFSWKYKDGDDTTPNTGGRRPCDNEGWPGHWVFFFQSNYAPQMFMLQEGRNLELTNADSNAIKRGYYVTVAGSALGNGSDDHPGIFLNGGKVRFEKFGPEISTGPSADDVFGTTAGQAPAGASDTPVAGAAPMPASTPAASTPAASAPPASAPTSTPATSAPPPMTTAPPPAASAPPPAPATDWVDNAGTPPLRTVIATGQQFTEAQLRASGWDDAAIQSQSTPV